MSPKLPVDDIEPSLIGGSEFATACDRVGIAIDRENAALSGIEQRPAVAAGAKRAVDIKRIRRWRQSLNNGLDQHRNVRCGSPHRSYRRRNGIFVVHRTLRLAVHSRRASAERARAGIRVPCWRARSRKFAMCSANRVGSHS